MKQVRLGGSIGGHQSVALGHHADECAGPDKSAMCWMIAYNDGINFIDSADIYGQGKSEEVFGEA